MRSTGSRESRDSRDASVTSPTSIAVKTFSIRFGSRRNQRPVHQMIRSIKTVSPMIDTIRIGHMIGPPLRNLSISQLLLSTPPVSATGAALATGDADAAGLKVVVTVVPGTGDIPAAGGIPCPGAGEVPTAGGIPWAGAPGAGASDMPGAAGGGIGAPGCAGAAALG